MCLIGFIIGCAMIDDLFYFLSDCRLNLYINLFTFVYTDELERMPNGLKTFTEKRVPDPR